MSDDTLRSGALIRTIDVISEGPIGGLVDGARSIYLDGTQLQNDDGSYNFTGVTWAERVGTVDQDYVQGFESVESVTSVGVQCKGNIPVTRTIVNDAADSVKIVIGVPALQHIDAESGESERTSVRLAVEVQANGGAWQPGNVGKASFDLKTASGSTVGTTSVNLTTSGKTTGVRATLRVKYSHTTGSSQIFPSQDPWVSYQLRYRKVGAATWTVAKENTIVAKLIKSEIVESGEDAFYQNLYEARESFNITLERGSAYEFNLLKDEEFDSSLGAVLSMTGSALEATNIITISGVSTSRYQRQVTVLLPQGGSPWNLQVTRLTDDSQDTRTQNDTYWDSFTVTTEDKMAYPFCAFVAMSFDSEQFSSIPTRGFECYGRLLKVPSNYNPIKRTYTGSWDGTFKTAWTDNPAWVFYDLITHPRYGLGKYITTADVYKWDLYTIAKYCDELVPTGFGGYEPRFTCNLYLAQRQEAFKLLQDIASVFRGMIYWAAGMIYVTQDAPGSAKAIYSPANVIDGLFTYSGTSIKTRHSVALVTWNDPDDLYRQKVEMVPDEESIALYGYVQTEITAMGCTSRGQALRAGRWLLYSERAEGETVSFQCGMDTMPRRPGELIKIADPGRAGVRAGGRIKASTASTVTLDAPVDLTPLRVYTLTTVASDGSLVDRTVTTPAGDGKTVLSLSDDYTTPPARGTMWMLSSSEVRPQIFRVLTLTESAPNIVDVTAVAHSVGKFDWIEEGIKIKPRSISVISSKPKPPESVSVKEVIYAKGQRILTRLIASWPHAENVERYVVKWRRNGGSIHTDYADENSIEILSAVEGQQYSISVYSINALGIRSAQSADLTHAVLGKLAPPSNVTGFAVARSRDTLTFSWRAVADVDASRYEIRRGSTWATGVMVASITHPTNSTQLLSPRGGKYLIKCIDTSEKESESVASATATDMSGINVVIQYDDGDRNFAGTLDANLQYQEISLGSTWATMPTWGECQTWAVPYYKRYVTTKPGKASGQYTTAAIDIGYFATSILHIDPWIDSPQATAPSGAVIGAEYDIRTSPDGVLWSDWDNFSPGSYQFRYMQLRVTLSCNQKAIDSGYLARLRDLSVKIDVPDRVEKFDNRDVPIGGLSLAFSPKFIGIQTVQVTLTESDVGDAYTVSNKTASGMTLRIYSSAGTPKAGAADITVYGYGERA